MATATFDAAASRAPPQRLDQNCQKSNPRAKIAGEMYRQARLDSDGSRRSVCKENCRTVNGN